MLVLDLYFLKNFSKEVNVESIQQMTKNFSACKESRMLHSYMVGKIRSFFIRSLLFSVCPSVCLSVVTLTQSFLIGFFPNFIYELLPSTFLSSSNMGFVQHPIIKMVNKMAAYKCPLSWSL